MRNKAIAKQYLQKYAEPSAKLIAQQLLSDLPNSLTFQHCLAIPTYNETSEFIQSLNQRVTAPGNLLVIIVINQPDTDSDTRMNQQLWEEINHLPYQPITQGKNYCLRQHHSRYLLTIDCFSGKNKLPKRQGVGLARKIACDVACHLFEQNYLTTCWLGNTDADTQLPQDYFLLLNDLDKYSAVVFPFRHHGENNAVTAATNCYEQAIHYYVEGLQWANSPYAFHTIGSCIAINLIFYVQVRGFPKRAAGEDFYLLNKLVKLAPIKSIDSRPILIKARESDRTPFGTGAAVRKILESNQTHEDYFYYNHQVFIELRVLLHSFKYLANQPQKANEWLEQQSSPQQTILKHLHIQKLLDHLSSQTMTEEQSYQAIMHWFDGLRTLRFIHQLGSLYPEEPLAESIANFKQRVRKSNDSHNHLG